jgi:hypothetical protein
MLTAEGQGASLTIFAPGSSQVIALMTIFFVILSDASVRGQEALRLSLAGDSVAQANQRAAATVGYYNLLIGPTSWSFTSGLGIFYNDNVFLEETDPKGDVIFQPNVTTQMHWPLTDRNSLDFTLGTGYSFYVLNPDLDQVFITPGSGISFDIYTGDVKINFHDRVSITESAYQTPGATNANYEQLQNTAGVLVQWDLNKALAAIEYEHANYVGLNSSEQQPPTASEDLLASFGIRFVPQITVGVTGGAGYFHSQQSGEGGSPDATQWSAGGYCNAQISEHLTTRLDAGYTEYLPEDTSTNSAASGGFYFDFSVSHAINQYFTYALSAGRSTDLQFSGAPTTHYFARFQPSWNFVRNYTVSVPFSWEKGTQIGGGTGVGSTDFEQFNTGISVSHEFSKRISGVLSYRFIKETSDQADSSYTVNVVGLSVAYRF